VFSTPNCLNKSNICFEKIKSRRGGGGANETQEITRVRELPPRESWRRRVSLLCRYGTCTAFLFSSVRALRGGGGEEWAGETGQPCPPPNRNDCNNMSEYLKNKIIRV
jgi:hypothetical protein